MESPASEGSAKVRVADRISRAVQSTSNLLHLMQQWSPSQVLEQMPQVLSSLDAYMVHGLQRVHLGAVTQLLANMERVVK